MIERIQTLAATDRSGSARADIPPVSGPTPVHVARSAICAVVTAEDCEASIAQCLARLQPSVNRICCLVGNSADRTGQIVQEYGGVIADGETGGAPGDESMRDADWLLYLRGDEVIEEDDLERLSRVLAAMPASVMAVALRALFRCCGESVLARLLGPSGATRQSQSNHTRALAGPLDTTRRRAVPGRGCQRGTVEPIAGRDIRQGVRRRTESPSD